MWKRASSESPLPPAQNAVPKCFISSTAEDLRQYRIAARDAAISAGFLPVMMEYFVASGDKPPLDNCLSRVDQADLIVVIVAFRYGWKPTDQASDGWKSITFLEGEEVDSGIIVSRGTEVRFWHLTFQEYLAARAISGLSDGAQHAFLLQQGRLYKPEWREVLLLLGGVLMRQGPAKVDSLFSVTLDHAYAARTLADQARCAGLLGAMLSDLQAFEYRPKDARYAEVLEAVRAVFDRSSSAVDFQIRLGAAEALGQTGDFRFAQENWLTVPAGEFWMGAQRLDPRRPNYDPDANEDEQPVRCLHLSEYQIGKYPVTVDEYRKFLDGDGYRDRKWWTAGGFGDKREPDYWDEQVTHPNRPVVGVNWYEASAYSSWAGARLPSEAEWQRAARGQCGRKYAWGKTLPDSDLANFGSNVGHATPVGLYAAGSTQDGIEDMTGNVWEWVDDLYRPYGLLTGVNPVSALAYQRVACGGAWNNPAEEVRAACRGRENPIVATRSLGFRCTRSAEKHG